MPGPQSIGINIRLGVRMKETRLSAIEHGAHARRISKTENTPATDN